MAEKVASNTVKSRQGEIIEEDPTKPKCCTCDYAVAVESSTEWSWCQKGAPVAAYNETLGAYKGSWPLVRNNDSCGEHPHYPRTRAILKLEEQLLLLREIKEVLQRWQRK